MSRIVFVLFFLPEGIERNRIMPRTMRAGVETDTCNRIENPKKFVLFKRASKHV